MNTGYVYLIGAGCGARDLITLRGLNRLRSCDAVVYDDLIDPALLEEVPPHARRLYMGKRSGKHSAPQEEISRTLITLARSGLRVARLKGGDPYVFGRGGEEVLALQAAGIPVEVVPGISSAIAIPGQAGIPVTHRGLSRSFHVITAHTRGGDLPEDLPRLAQLHGTLVFLMGLHALPKLAQALLENGKDPATPAAVISGGNAPQPMTVRGTLGDIAEKAAEAGVLAPAVIVVGETAGLDLNAHRLLRPLEGVRVGLTGTDAITGKLSTALSSLGAAPVSVERSRVVPLSPVFPEPKEGRWLVFTGANGVRLFFRQLRDRGIDLRRLARCKFAVIGKPTGEALAEHGILADLCPPVFTSEALGQALTEAVSPGEEVLLLRSWQGAAILPELLRRAGIPVRDIPLYDLLPDPEVTERSRPLLQALDYLTFSSAGGLRLFLQEHGALPEKAVCVCIGSVTAKALAAVTDRPFLTAETTDAEGIVRAIVRHHS